MTAVLQRVEFTFRPTIAVHEVEELLARHEPRDDDGRSWSLDFAAVGHVQPGAGYRLGNALQRWSRGEVLARVPDPGDFSGRWFQTFTRSGIGLALARHATQILTADADITERVRAYYAEKGAVSSTNYAVHTEIEDGDVTSDIDRFAATFLRLGRFVRLDSSLLSQEERRALVTLAFEAGTNIVDHAYKNPWEYAGATLSYLSLRYYETMRAQAGETGLAEYLARVGQALERANEGTLGWVEIVVCDDGVGIAARQSRNLDIAREPIQAERTALHQALTARQSIKLVTRDAVTIGEPGFGYTLIADALTQLKGHAVLRTGRLLAELDGTQPNAPGFVLHEEPLGWLPGTALHIVLPLRDPQLRISA